MPLSPFQWFRRSSLAIRLAFLVGIFQIAIVLFATIAVLVAGELAVLQLWWSPGKILAIVILFVAVPVLVHRATLLWCEQTTARWPDIASSWRAAIADLKRQNVDLEEWPVFIVLGTDGGSLESALLNSSASPLIVSGTPGHGEGLHLYATADAVYVCLGAIGRSGRAAGACRAMVDGRTASHGQHEEASRLDAVCDLLIRERSPYVPVNGYLAVLPLDLGRQGSQAVNDLGTAIAADLQQLTRRLHVRVPVTFLCTGLEHEAGLVEFFEMLAANQQPRINPDQTVSTPTGRERAEGSTFPVGIRPTSTHITAVSANAVGPLTDQIAERLLDPSSQAKQWTRIRLLKMLCRLRLHGAAQLGEILGKVFPEELSAEEFPLLAGAFAGALGEDKQRQGFLQGVLASVVEQQAELQWTRRRVEADAWAKRASRTLFVGGILLLIATVGMLWWKLFA